MPQLFRVASITDEFSPDIEKAVTSMAGIGMTGAELRMLYGKNIIDLTDEELDRAKQICSSHGMEIMSIASPLLKCVLPGAPEVDSRFQQDMFAAKHNFEDQPRLTLRAFQIAHRLGARIIRVFSYWRSVEPEKCFDGVLTALRGLADKAAKEDLIIGLENEHACNIATASETARVLDQIDHPNLQVVWDPANCYISGENPYPEGYRKLPISRIAHVHAKDCHVDGHKPIWGPVGEGGIDWRGQIAALAVDGYKGWLSLETHWPGPGNDKHLASMICGQNLKSLVMV
ncbi:MAG TPA: sugar phosphate isomerase/epimerase family protein [Bryobacteraceae bacterium]|jgi:sugar phosphate isomerase/epimerase|nr:sugar phosphate isomerase/epimerase family protein [Bryobacteraceae bacterium]